jgi:uncharacterized protein (DUF433 family)
MLDDNSIAPTPEQWKAEGEARLLIRSLERKFGKLEEEPRTIIYRLDADTLLDCVERLAMAQSVAEVLPQADLSTSQPLPVEIEETDSYSTVTNTAHPTVVRTTKGLSIAGTRLTIYDIMDYITQNWSSGRIQHWFRLSDKQINDIMEYLDQNRFDVETEYRQVLEYAEEKRYYWREHQQRLSTTSPQSDRTEFWATLRKRQLERSAE